MSADRNLFAHVYHKAEDQYTEALVKFLANGNDRVINTFLRLLDLGIDTVHRADVVLEMQQSQKNTRPDATVSSAHCFKVHIETKLGRWFDPRQLAGHLGSLRDANCGIRAVVLLTSAIAEPPGFATFVAAGRWPRGVSLRHLSWREIGEFAQTIAKTEDDAGIRMLARHLAEFVEREVGVRWTGFEKDFCRKWIQFIQFRDAHAKLLSSEVKEQIGSFLEKHHEGYQLGSGGDFYVSGDRMYWNLRHQGYPPLNLHISLASGDDAAAGPHVGVWWYGNPATSSKLSRDRRYARLIAKLEETSRFKFSGPTRIGRDKPVDELTDLPPDEQLARIVEFIEKAITDFHRSGIIEQMKRVLAAQ
jgi:hypothetical protein